jgi:glycosyltransferase involved in cell wall biosynthesis
VGVAGTPLVSVLLPVRNGAATLGGALDSLLAQTLADFEVIVVDDGSGDGSDDLAKRYARADPRVRVVRRAPHGLVAALERGRSLARAPLIARMDADDVALPHRLAVQVAALEAEPALAACGGRVELFPRSAVRDGMRRYEAWVNALVTAELAARDVFVECPLPHPTLVARAEAIDGAGGYRDRGWPEDYDLVLRLWARGLAFRNVTEVVLRWQEHPARLSRRSGAYAQGAFVRCKVHHLRETMLRGRDGAVIWGAGPVGKAFARELQAQGERVVAFVEVDPRKLGRRIHGVPVVPIEEAPGFGDALALGAVAGEQARAEIRQAAASQGRRDGVDFVAVA